jgi:hypothetical protein
MAFHSKELSALGKRTSGSIRRTDGCSDDWLKLKCGPWREFVVGGWVPSGRDSISTCYWVVMKPRGALRSAGNESHRLLHSSATARKWTGPAGQARKISPRSDMRATDDRCAWKCAACFALRAMPRTYIAVIRTSKTRARLRLMQSRPSVALASPDPTDRSTWRRDPTVLRAGRGAGRIDGFAHMTSGIVGLVGLVGW